MGIDVSELARRSLLQIAAGLTVAGTLGMTTTAREAAVPPAASGKPGDFDFLTGE